MFHLSTRAIVVCFGLAMQSAALLALGATSPLVPGPGPIALLILGGAALFFTNRLRRTRQVTSPADDSRQAASFPTRALHPPK